jgi:hypothetical protein
MRETFTTKASIDQESGAILLEGCRLSYPHLTAPAAVKGQDGRPTGAYKYSASFICNFDPESKALITEFLNRAWKERLKVPEPIPGKSFISNGNHKTQKEYHGFSVIAANENADKRPEVYDRNGKLTEDPNACYSGCIVNAIIRPWIQDNSWGKRVNAGLVGVQFVDDFERLGAAVVQASSLFKGVDRGAGYTSTPTPQGAVVGQDDGYFDEGASTASNPPARSGEDDNLPF